MPSQENIIEAQALTKKFGQLVAVDHIDFAIKRGTCFGFLGPNGAGKTSTIRMIHQAAQITSGTLMVFGIDLKNIQNAYALKEKIGVVPQEDNLDQELTAKETLEVFARFYGLRGNDGSKRAAELLDLVHLNGKANTQVEHLSGGMRRRLQIARALIGRPELLILDEPTTGLDPQMRNELWNQLKSLKKQNVTMVLTTHYMNEAEQLCDELVIMDLGKIVALGHPHKLIEKHVPPFVVEILFDDKLMPDTSWLKQLKLPLEDFYDIADRTLLYTRDPDRLVKDICHFHEQATVYRRHATLDDVFLKITGRQLST